MWIKGSDGEEVARDGGMEIKKRYKASIIRLVEGIELTVGSGISGRPEEYWYNIYLKLGVGDLNTLWFATYYTWNGLDNCLIYRHFISCHKKYLIKTLVTNGLEDFAKKRLVEMGIWKKSRKDMREL